jgi:hypothetical protein
MSLGTSAIADFYVAHFTPDELKALVSWHRSPTGPRLIGQQPTLLPDVMRATSGTGGAALGARCDRHCKWE